MTTIPVALVVKTLPSPAEMYRALVERDASYEGVFVAAIRTTGVFCRPGCGAKRPRPENVEFYATAEDAERRGFRACLRCRPLESRTGSVREASKWTSRHLGITPTAGERSRRLGDALDRLRSGSSVTDAALASGYESESGFRDAFVRLFGAPPTRAVASGADAIRVRWLATPLGPVLAGATGAGICLLEFADRRALRSQVARLRKRLPLPVVPGTGDLLEQLEHELDAYFRDARSPFRVPILCPGTPFQVSVWDRLRAIPAGETRSYADVARAIGRPTAVRAVARANGENRVAILVPCHRVIGSDGSPTGYGGGLWRKRWLLAHERARSPAL